jgi:hypothetical protein
MRPEEDKLHLEIVELLPWYLNGTLETKEHDNVTQHIENCLSCRRELEELKGLQKAITAPTIDFSTETALAKTIQQIRSQERTTEKTQRAWWQLDWAPLLRPRLALGVAIMAAIFIGTGMFVGLQLQAEKRVKFEEQGQALTEEYNVMPFVIWLQGTFRTTMDKQTLSQESFSLLFNKKSQDLLLNSKIEASEFTRAGQATQNLQLTGDYRPLAYTIDGPLVYEGNQAEARFTDQQAVMTLPSSIQSNQAAPARVVDLTNFPVILDFSVMSHYAIFHRLLTERLSQGETIEKLQFTALAPQALKADTLSVTKLETASLMYQGKAFEVRRYDLEIGSSEKRLKVELYEEKRSERRVLVAIHIPAQSSLPSPSAIFVYRNDLYPEGLELAEGAK